MKTLMLKPEYALWKTELNDSEIAVLRAHIHQKWGPETEIVLEQISDAHAALIAKQMDQFVEGIESMCLEPE